MAIDVFSVKFSSSAIDADKASIRQFLKEYLDRGSLPAIPRIMTGPQIRLDGPREPLGQCSWKWSEVNGKYVGCQFWSQAAAMSIRDLANVRNASSLRQVEKEAQSRERKDLQLQHEHVFPRKDWILKMSPHVGRERRWSPEDLTDLLDRYCVGCIVTKREDNEIRTRRASESNPWLRYSGTSIRLVDNPTWPEIHRRWIMAAALSA